MHMKRFFILPLMFVFGLLMAFSGGVRPTDSIAPFTVVLDAGHGGHDPGNLGNGYMEKNIALNIVLEVGRLLEQQPDVKVIYTRRDDSFVDLYLRGKIANDADADLFVSVHCDSHSSDAHGAGTFVLGLHANEQNFEIAKKENSVIYLEDDYETRYAEYDINSPESVIGLTIMQEEFLDQSIALAKMMQDEFSEKLKRNDRQVKQAGFIVLHQTFMPSVLVETGFLTNKSEGSYLNSSKGQLEMGRAIAEAILAYKDNVRSQPGNLIASSTPKSAPVKNTSTQAADVKEKSTPPAIPVKKEETVAAAEEVTNSLPAVEKEIKAEKEVEQPVVASPPPASAENKEKASGDLAMATVVDDQPKTVQPPATSVPAEEKAPESVVTFKIQLLASSRDLPLRPSDFNGLSRLSKEPYKNLYRYLYGSTGSFKEAQLLKSNADMKGYTSSFIVAYKDGVRITIEEAMKYVTEK